MAELIVTAPVVSTRRCRSGCGLSPRSSTAILADIEEAPKRALSEAAIASRGDPGQVDPQLRARLTPRLTRFQLELAGYCQTCALRGQLSAAESGLGRATHG